MDDTIWKYHLVNKYSVFNSKNRDGHSTSKMFLDKSVTIARYDKQKYSFLEKLTDKQLGFFWRPEEVDVYRDSKDFKNLT